MHVCIQEKPVKLTNNNNRCITCYKIKPSIRSDINPPTAISSEQHTWHHRYSWFCSCLETT